MTNNDTPEIALRIRVKSLPIPGEFDEFDLDPSVGGTYELPLQLASLLILGGVRRAGRFRPPLAEAAAASRAGPDLSSAANSKRGDPAFVACYASASFPTL